FVDIKILEIAVEYRLISLLAEEPATVEQLAKRAKLPERSMGYLLIGLGGMGLLTFDEGRYKPSALGAKYLVESSPFFYGQAVRYWAWNFDALQRFKESMVEDKPVWEGFAHYLKEASNAGLETNEKKRAVFNDAI